MNVVERGYFEALADALCGPMQGEERVSLMLSAESSSFIRFNRGAVRQATHVEQAVATLSLVHGRRHAEVRATLAGRVDDDIGRLRTELDALRALLPELPDDPYLLLPDATSSFGSFGSMSNTDQSNSESSSGLLFTSTSLSSTTIAICIIGPQWLFGFQVQ